MVRKSLATSMTLALALALSGALAGCSKSEPPKEEPKPAAQQAAPSAPAGGTAVAEFTFEDGIQKWYPRKGVKTSQDKSQGHGGAASLKITGTSAKGNWDFTQSQRFSLVPGKQYKFSGWMKVDSINPVDSKTYVWLRVSLFKDNQWNKNVIGRNYNLKKKGEWQQLTGEFVAPEGSDIAGMFVVDKRPETKDITATIYLDDVRIEQVN